MFNAKTIKIPRGLALAVTSSSKDRKIIDTFLTLKHEFNHGYFHYSIEHLKDLETVVNTSYKTLQTRLRLLIEKGLATKKNGSIYLESYECLLNVYNVKSTSFYRYNLELCNKVKIENILATLALQEKQEECKHAFYWKLSKHNLMNVIVEGAFNGQKPKNNFREQLLVAHLADYICLGKDSEMSYAFNAARPDTNLSYAYMSKMFGYKSKGGMAYMKRKLKALKLVQIQARSVDFERTLHTKRYQRTIHLGAVMYNHETKGLKVILPDNITFLSQKQSLQALNTAPFLSSNLNTSESCAA